MFTERADAHAAAPGIWGLGIGVCDLGFGVWVIGVWDLGSGIWGLWDLGSEVRDPGLQLINSFMRGRGRACNN